MCIYFHSAAPHLDNTDSVISDAASEKAGEQNGWSHLVLESAEDTCVCACVLYSNQTWKIIIWILLAKPCTYTVSFGFCQLSSTCAYIDCGTQTQSFHFNFSFLHCKSPLIMPDSYPHNTDYAILLPDSTQKREVNSERVRKSLGGVGFKTFKLFKRNQWVKQMKAKLMMETGNTRQWRVNFSTDRTN